MLNGMTYMVRPVGSARGGGTGEKRPWTHTRPTLFSQVDPVSWAPLTTSCSTCQQPPDLQESTGKGTEPQNEGVFRNVQLGSTNRSYSHMCRNSFHVPLRQSVKPKPRCTFPIHCQFHIQNLKISEAMRDPITVTVTIRLDIIVKGLWIFCPIKYMFYLPFMHPGNRALNAFSKSSSDIQRPSWLWPLLGMGTVSLCSWVMMTVLLSILATSLGSVRANQL